MFSEFEKAPMDRPLALRRKDEIHRPLTPDYAHRSVAVASAGPSPALQGLTPAFLWWTFRQWWAWALPVGLLLAGIAASVIIFSFEPDFSASALILIEENAPYIAFSKVDASGGSGRYVDTQLAIMRDPLVLNQVLSADEIGKLPHLAAAVEPISEIQKRLSISRVQNSELFNVTYTCKSAAEAAKVANAVVLEYLDQQVNNDRKRFDDVVHLLEQQHAERKVILDNKRRELMELAGAVTGRDPFGYGTTVNFEIAHMPAAATYQELVRLDVDLRILEAQLRAYEGAAAADGVSAERTGLIDLQLSDHPVIREAESAINGLMAAAEAEKAVKIDPTRDPKYQRIQEQLKQQQASLEELRVRVRGEIQAEQEREQQARHEARIAALRDQINHASERRRILEIKFQEELEKASGGSRKAIELQFKQAELAREERVFELITSRLVAMQTEVSAPPRVKVQRTATPPVKPVSELPYKQLLLVCGLALAAPFGLATLRELCIRRISDVEQVARETGVRVLGEVASFPIRRVAANAQLLPARLRRQMFVYLESIDSLRTNIALSVSGEKQLLVVTSGAAGEGKTCLSTSLAMSLAKAEKKPVLVIDADLRAPDVASVLNVKQRPGLAEVLRKEITLTDAIQRVGKTDVHVIAAGRLRGNPHHLLREELVRPLLDELRRNYATIIVDTPPLFGGSESLLLAKLSDGVILSVLSDSSRLRQLKQAQANLERAGANLLGVVLNGRTASSYAYAYGYGGYSKYLQHADPSAVAPS